MKKIFVILFLFKAAFAGEVLAPAVQFDKENYQNYFKSEDEYKINLKSRNNYLLSCREGVIGINWGDIENIEIFDFKDEKTGANDLNRALIKIKYETYSFMRLYKTTGEIANVILTINPIFELQDEILVGSCKITPYRG